jgi:hypothetical protein
MQCALCCCLNIYQHSVSIFVVTNNTCGPCIMDETNRFFFAFRTWNRHSVDRGQDVEAVSTDLHYHLDLMLWIIYTE